MTIHNEKGFSLIEMMVAVTILAFGLLALAGLQITAIQGNGQGNTTSQATNFAEDRIETIRNTDYANITNTTFPASETVGDIYTRQTQIEIDTPMNDLKRITVTVSWSTDRDHQVVLRTIVANGG